MCELSTSVLPSIVPPQLPDVVLGNMDDVIIVVHVNLRERCSRLNFLTTQPRILRNRASCQFRSIQLSDDAPRAFRKFTIGLFAIQCDPKIDVVLGMDWYQLCLQNISPHSRIHPVYVDKIFDVRNKLACIFNQDETALIFELHRHGKLECIPTNRLPTLISHMIRGECSRSPHQEGCRDLIVCSGTVESASIVRHIVSRVRTMSDISIPSSYVSVICQSTGLHRAHFARVDCISSLVSYSDLYGSPLKTRCADLDILQTRTMDTLRTISYAHGLLSYSPGLTYRNITGNQVRNDLYTHIMTGSCSDNTTDVTDIAGLVPYSGCSAIRVVFGPDPSDGTLSPQDLKNTIQRNILRHCRSNFGVHALTRLTAVLNITVTGKAGVNTLQTALTPFINSIGIAVSGLNTSWPRVVSDRTKAKLVLLFKEATGKAVLLESVCASCGERLRIKDQLRNLNLKAFDPALLTPPQSCDRSYKKAIAGSRFITSPLKPTKWSPYIHDMLVDWRGLRMSSDGPEIIACEPCHDRLSNGKQPRFAFSNGNVLGDIPIPLVGLTPVEESMIARCRAKCMIVQLQESQHYSPNTQRGIKGHVIVFPQNPDKLSTVLPPTPMEIGQYICVVFIGSHRPDDKWINENAKPLGVRRERIRHALLWFKENNELYKDVVIDHARINMLPLQGTAPYQFEFRAVADNAPDTTSSYDPVRQPADKFVPRTKDGKEGDIVFHNVVIADVDGDSSMNTLKAAAIRHLRNTQNSFVEVPHGEDPVNEFYNPSLFPSIAPTLFPYGIGGLEDATRTSRISMDAHVRHLIMLDDRRFQKHVTFFFTAFNMLQRRQMLLRTKLKVDTQRFDAVADSITKLSISAIERVTDRLSRGEAERTDDPEERRVTDLMKEVKAITSHVPGSAASRVTMRNEIRGLMMTCGMPNYFVTINPADVYNPLVKFLGGADIDIDALLPEQVPDYWEQSILVARNPAVAAKFFNVYIKAFITSVLGYDCDDDEVRREGGILGKVNAYYGCVEAQGRGTLHCHMLIWIRGGLNPDELKIKLMQEPNGEFSQRLIHMLDDTISNTVPFPRSVTGQNLEERIHPCSIRGVPIAGSEHDRQLDLHNLVDECQTHSHSDTCYKYWRGPPEPKTCRFDLDPGNVKLVSTVDADTGELHLRCLNGLVNNFNLTIIESVRCNMDIKFIGSGRSAKAVLYYITDYVTKTQLKAHVAFSALELATRKLGEFDSSTEDPIGHAKRLLQKCAYALISHQELSAQQVMSYLLGYEDHFTSHVYRNLYWTSFERALERMDPAAKLSTAANTESDLTDRDEYTASVVDDQDMFAVEEEVVIASEWEEIVPRLGPVSDYLLRGALFEDLTVWDFISQTRKVQGQKRYNPVARPAVPTGLTNIDSLLRDSSRNRPSDTFLPLHLQHKGYVLRIVLPSDRLVPVPTGPGIPRRGRPDTHDRYSRLMLILFKPWRCLTDLKRSSVNWSDAFQEFQINCSARYLGIMHNMQLLHECKDSRDDHFEQRRSRNRLATEVVSSTWMQEVSQEADDVHGDETIDDILTHITSMEESRSRHNAKVSASVRALVVAAESAGLFSSSNVILRPMSPLLHENVVRIVRGNGPHCENDWKVAYERVRDCRKSRLMEGQLQSDGKGLLVASTETLHAKQRAVQATPVTVRLDEALAMEIRSNPGRTAGGDQSNSSEVVSVDRMIEIFELNQEQARAFSLICHAATKPRGSGEPLRMYLGGSGGTGKSRVIIAVRNFFDRRNEGRRLRLASYTGVAAHNIGGMTVHAALNLCSASNQQSKAGRGKTQRDLVAMWDGVDFLFVDEVSMIGCKFMFQIHKALCLAKGNDRPFGSVNVIFAGDFAQLPPVGQRKLFAKLDVRSSAESGTVSGQQNIMGKLLWLQVRDVVILHQQMRQGGQDNEPYAELLERLRHGRCSQADYDLLNTRLSSNCQPSVNETWLDTPIVVSSNAAKDALNEHASGAFAKQYGLDLDWYYARDFHHGRPIDDPRIKDELYNYHSGRTSHRLHRLPLMVGLPVMLSQNYDVDNGAVNGTIGRIRSIRYESEGGLRHALSCVLTCPTYTGVALPHLNAMEFAVLEDSVDITLEHPHSMKRLVLKRKQLPITPAFAFTVYKSQGLTLASAAVDIESCRTTEEAYTMLSRVKSLKSLLILRPFSADRISCRQSEDSRTEFKRLNQLHLMTKKKYAMDSHETGRLNEQIGSAIVPEARFDSTTKGARNALRDFQEAIVDSLRQADEQMTDPSSGQKRKPSTTDDLRIKKIARTATAYP